MSEYQDQLSKFLAASDEPPDDDSPQLSHDDAAAQRQHPVLESMAQGLGRVSDFFKGGNPNQNNPAAKLSSAIPGLLGIDAMGNTLHRFAMGDAHHYDAEERDAALADYVGAAPLGLGAGGVARKGLRAALEGSIRQDGKTAVGMFAGQHAATSDLGALSQAKLQKAAGKSPEEIHSATGWMQGVDGHWKYEIDDSTSAWKAEQYRNQQREPEKRNLTILKTARDLKYEAESSGESIDRVLKRHEMDTGERLPDAVKGLAHSESGARLHDMMMGAYSKFNAPMDAKLGDILQHQRLYEAYPHLKDADVHFNDLGPTIAGSADSYNLNMKLNSRNSYGSAGKETVLHEIQHFIQNHEGFDPGESEGRLMEDNLRKVHSHAEYEDTIQAAIDIRNGNNLYRHINNDAAELADDRSTPTKDLETYLATLKQNRPERITPDKAREMYNAAGGEVEARATEKRRRMSQIDRSKSFPMDSYDTPPEKILLRNQR